MNEETHVWPSSAPKAQSSNLAIGQAIGAVSHEHGRKQRDAVRYAREDKIKQMLSPRISVAPFMAAARG